ncbi:hypothetical protein KIN20_012534 [Parelaphostrongylus tenuis]|uniref:Uncharacterized protein n=1 Tax=Parelaphostrongylus tenuis TaxID=148309 RepID=A0AAD5QQI0_PARTN|nr:hypothetical protein KIN20_012534 [Parelaphostrongylus tenuis]
MGSVSGCAVGLLVALLQWLFRRLWPKHLPKIPEDQGVISPERFSAFSAAIIPIDEMLNRLAKLNFRDYKVMGHPIGLKHETWYARGQLDFNMCFVVAKESTIDCVYEPLVQKFAEYLVDLEMESPFL